MVREAGQKIGRMAITAGARILQRTLKAVTVGVEVALITAITASVIGGLTYLAHYFGWIDFIGAFK